MQLMGVLCEANAPFLDHPVCDEWHGFEAGAAPSLPVGKIAIGATFRVEQARTGARVWSELNPLLALMNASDTEAPRSVRMLHVSADNPSEQQEANEYIRQLFAGTAPASSGLYQYITTELPKAPAVPVTTEPNQSVTADTCGTRSYIRQAGERLYVLTGSTHSNAWEYDNHPVIYFSILGVQ